MLALRARARYYSAAAYALHVVLYYTIHTSIVHAVQLVYYNILYNNYSTAWSRGRGDAYRIIILLLFLHPDHSQFFIDN